MIVQNKKAICAFVIKTQKSDRHLDNCLLKHTAPPLTCSFKSIPSCLLKNVVWQFFHFSLEELYFLSLLVYFYLHPFPHLKKVFIFKSLQFLFLSVFIANLVEENKPVKIHCPQVIFSYCLQNTF